MGTPGMDHQERWEHFPHVADVGVRGLSDRLEGAFEQAARALTAIITDPDTIEPREQVTVRCRAPDRELLLVDWLNAVIYEMAVRGMLFCRFTVHIDGEHLTAELGGEPADRTKHQPAVEVKGATYTELRVAQLDGLWIAQCVVDV